MPHQERLEYEDLSLEERERITYRIESHSETWQPADPAQNRVVSEIQAEFR